MKRAAGIALEAERLGNPPIGSVITIDDVELAVGACSILHPVFDPGRHAEMEALSNVPSEFWPRASEMTCYSTLEPCPMCLGSLLLHDVGRVVFGASDPLGGGGVLLSHLPRYFDRPNGKPTWIGPIDTSTCEPLYYRAVAVLGLKDLM